MSYEQGLANLLDNSSVLEVVAIQLDMFRAQKGVEPTLVQVNFQLRPAFIRDFARAAGISVDAVFGLQSLLIGPTAIMFSGMPADEYIRIYGPGPVKQVL